MKSNAISFMIRTEDNLARALKELAQAQGYSLSELVRIVLRSYAESKGYLFK